MSNPERTCRDAWVGQWRPNGKRATTPVPGSGLSAGNITGPLTPTLRFLRLGPRVFPICALCRRALRDHGNQKVKCVRVYEK
jgi:hypothetical protein